MTNPIRFYIQVRAEILLAEYGNKEKAFGALGRFLDQVANQYGGIVSNLECTQKEYTDNGTSQIMLESVTAVMHCRGITHVDVDDGE